ncbi:PDZ domain [Phytophthora cactorum]|nr:PDZ domain [Phytophthora cactorum]
MAVPKDSRSSPTSCSTVTSSRDSSSAFAASKRGVMPEPTAMVRLSPATEVAIRLLPGNDRCVDCKAVCPQWAGVSFGVLLYEFVKSLVMDAWSANEVCALELGGNAKWVAVCAGTGVSDLPMETKYSSGVAKAYKSRVALAAAKDPSVSRVLPGGAAERANVIVGSLLIGLNNTKNLKFDELWACFERCPTDIVPLRLPLADGVRGAKTVISTVPEPTTVEINVTLHDKEELGCSLAGTSLTALCETSMRTALLGGTASWLGPAWLL